MDDDEQLLLALEGGDLGTPTPTETRAEVAAKLATLLQQAQRRPIRLGSCRECTRPFVIKRSDHHHCSSRCRVRAHRRRATEAASRQPGGD
jgi:hypothetical protein